MDRAATRDLLLRLERLERTSVQHRLGIVTDTTPLSVALGGSDIAYTDVKTIATGLAVDDVVSVLQFGNDLLVLGKVV